VADNTQLNSGSGGDTVATDDIGGIKFQRVKVVLGGDGTNDGDVASGNPLPISHGGLTELAAAINASSQMDVNIAASGATVPVSNAGLTELAAAINASQLDVNIAASGATVPVSHAALTELAAAIDTEVQVDVVAALPAGDNNIGNVDLASAIPAGTNNIGDVDVLSVPAPLSTTGGGLEATALRVTIATDSTGVLSVDDNGASLSIDDGGNTITVDGTVAVTNAGLTELAAAINASSQMDVNIAASGATVPVSLTSTTVTGTVAVTQSGTWDEVGIHDSGNSITVDNGGTFATQVDGAALTALQLIDDPVATLGTTTYSEATTKGMIVGAVRRDADTTLVDTTNEVGPLQMDANGRLKVEAFSGETLPVSLASVPSHAVTNAGTFPVQVDGSALTALQLIDDPVLTDDAAFTPATSKVMMAGFEADEASIDSVDEGDAGAARMTLDRKVIVTPQPHGLGGLSIFRSLDLDETEEDVKTSAGAVYGCWVTNTATATRWLKFYNATAANVTVGSTTPVITIGIPGNTSDDISGNFGPGGMGIQFDTAISVAATTAVADADTGAPSANDVIVNIFYK
jgi:hypothetical protein